MNESPIYPWHIFQSYGILLLYIYIEYLFRSFHQMIVSAFYKKLRDLHYILGGYNYGQQ